MRSSTLLLATLLLLGCDNTTTVFDGGPGDSSTPTDSSTPVDSSTPEDADPPSDGGPSDGSMATGPEGPDVDTPFPIDRGDDPDTPGSYKGLPLRLVERGEPTIEAVDGVIGVVCVGMSNATQECSAYISALGSDLVGVNAQVEVIDCAVGGHAIEKWADPAFDPPSGSR